MIRKFLRLFAFVPMYVIGFMWTLAIYSEDYYFMAMKVNAAIGLLAIYYVMYKGTLYLQEKLLADTEEKQVEEENND